MDSRHLLSSPTYSSFLLKGLNSLLEQHQLVDFTLVSSDGVEFLVHSVVLMGCSRFFRALLDSGSLKDRCYILSSASGACLKIMIQFMYTGQLDVDDANINELLSLAMHLEIDPASVLCQEFVASKPGSSSKKLDAGVHDNIATMETNGPSCKSRRTRRGKQTNSVCTSVNNSKEIQANKNIKAAINDGCQRETRKRKLKTDGDDVTGAMVRGAAVGESDLIIKPDPDGPDSASQWSSNCWKSTNRHDRKTTDQDRPDKLVMRIRNKSTSRTARIVGSPSTDGTDDKKMDLSELHATIDDVQQEFVVTKRPRGRPKGSKNKPKGSVVKPDPRMKHCSKKLVTVAGIPGRNINVRSRVKNKFKKEKLTCCDICDEAFYYHSAFSLHRRKHFTNVYPSLCSKSAVKQATRVARSAAWEESQVSRTATGDCEPKNLHCPQCQKTFRYHSVLSRHIQLSHSRQDKSKDKPYGCTSCRKSFLSWKALQIHNFNNRHGIFQMLCRDQNWFSEHGIRCQRCGRRFLYKKTLQSHRRNMSCVGIEKCWRCSEPSCQGLFQTRVGLILHMKRHHPDVNHSCPHCVFQTPVQDFLHSHLRRHHGETGTRVCETCGRTFSKPYYLKLHMYSRHKVADPTIKLYRCTHEGCDYACVFRDGMRKHSLRHQADKPFACLICSKSFKTEFGLEKHTRKVHLGIRPYMCDVCGSAYGDESELKVHMARHNSVHRFRCDHCNYSSHDKGNFKTHLYSRHAVKLENNMKIYECRLCEYTCDIKSRYTDHMRVHLNQRDIACPQCDKLFMTRKAMTGHVRKVHHPKHLRCETCAYMTSDVSKLREHLRIMHTHRDFKPYKCPYCGFQCATSGNCRKHVKGKHRGMPVKYVKLTDESAFAKGDVAMATRSKPRKSAANVVAQSDQFKHQQDAENVATSQGMDALDTVQLSLPMSAAPGFAMEMDQSAVTLGGQIQQAGLHQVQDLTQIQQLQLPVTQSNTINMATALHLMNSANHVLVGDSMAGQWQTVRYAEPYAQ